MPSIPRANRSGGFAVIELLLILACLVAIAAGGAFIYHFQHTQRQSTATTATSTTPPSGTSASVEQLTQQDAKYEAGADSSNNNQAMQTVTGPNSAVTYVGSAYDETAL